jgi:asparagine synthase (glutamine-hydrolysing)
VTPDTVESDVLEARYVRWIARFRRTRRGGADLRLECVDGATIDPRSSTAGRDGLKVALRGVLFERADLARVLALESIPDSDAELALHAYTSWGRDGIRRLRGVFALFVWDPERECLLAARDHLGAEPLFYARAGEEMLFAASPSTLLTQPGVSRAPNPTVLVEAIYWHLPVPEETSLLGVQRVLPGHVLTVTNVSATSKRYWNPFDDLHEQGWVEADELGEFDRLLERSVSQCLDLGPGGIFLSGGLDSVSIAAVAADLAEHRGLSAPLALSLVFPTPETTEEEVQAGVAGALRLPQVMLGLEDSVAPDGLVRRALDLSADWPLPRTYLWSGAYLELARAGAANGARVIMTGGGGDEWLTVDLKLAADFIQTRQFRSLYRFTRSKMDSFSVPARSTLRYVLWEYGLREVLRFHARALLARYTPSLLEARRRRALARAALPWVAPDPRIRADAEARLQEERARRQEQRAAGGRFRFYASDGGLVLDHPELSAQREDDHEVGRRVGAEFFHPYWEPDLLTFLYRVPPELLLQGGLEKGLVRSTIARRFPSFGFERQRKVVSADYHYSIIRRDGPAALRRLEGCRTLAEIGVVDRRQVDAFITGALAGSNHRELYRAWELLTLETWVRRFA